MLQINASPAQKNTAQKNVHYPAFLKLDDNRRIGFSKAYNGTTDAKGTLYPTNFSSQSTIGEPQTQISAEHGNSGGFPQDNSSFTNNEVKHKTGERWVQKYRALKSISMASVQRDVGVGACNMPSSGGLRVNKILPVSTDKFMVIYQQNSPSGLYARIGTLNASTGAITYGTAVQISSNGTQWGYVDFESINTDKFAIIYRDGSNNINVVVCTVSGTTITLGTAHTTAVTTGTTVRIRKVDTDKFLYQYTLGSTETRMRICTVSGTTITAGTDTSVSTSRYSSDVQMQSTTLGLVVQTDSNGLLYARAFSISGTTPTFNTEVQLSSTGYSMNGIQDNIFIWVSGGLYYFQQKANQVPLLIEVVATVPSVVDSTTVVYDENGNGSCYYMTAPITVGTAEYFFAYTNASNNGLYSASVVIDTTNKKISFTAIPPYYKSSYSSLGFHAVQKIGSQYIAIGNTTSDNASALSEAVFTEASVELRYNAESSAFATLSNAKYAWTYKPYNCYKVLGGSQLFLNLKNVSGATRNIVFKDFYVEVD